MSEVTDGRPLSVYNGEQSGHVGLPVCWVDRKEGVCVARQQEKGHGVHEIPFLNGRPNLKDTWDVYKLIMITLIKEFDVHLNLKRKNSPAKKLEYDQNFFCI